MALSGAASIVLDDKTEVREGDIIGDFEVTGFPKQPGKSQRIRLTCPFCGHVRDVRILNYEYILHGTLGRPTCRHTSQKGNDDAE
jgi:hypothetical protein